MAQAIEDQNEKQKHVEMIQSPGEWVHWPILPLKHRRRNVFGDDGLGILVATKAPPYVVYVTDMFRLAFQPKGTMLAQALRGVATETYDDIDALVNDWEVD